MAAKIIKAKKDFKSSDLPTRPVADITPDSGGILSRRVLDAREKAERIIADAKEEATRVCDEARVVLQGATARTNEAIRKGYAEGESKGLGLVTENLLHLKQLREQFYHEAEPEIIKLVMTIAEKVIGQIAEENPELIRSVVHKAIEKTIGDRITIRINPEDYRALISGDHEFRDILDRTRHLLFREDETITRGGCIVETEVGTIDAQIETQLAAIRKALTA